MIPVNLLAIAELRLRGAWAARLAWLFVPAAAAGVGFAAWAPGTDPHVRAESADALAMSACAAVALLAVLVLAATTLAGEIRTAVAHALMSAPLSRWSLVAGGVVGHAAFGVLLAVGLCASAAIGLDLGGLGSRARDEVRPVTDVVLDGPGADGVVVISKQAPEIRGRFVVPSGMAAGDEFRVELAPRGQVESSFESSGVLEVSVGRPGDPTPPVRVKYKASVDFEARVPVGDLRAGDVAELTLRRVRGGWRLRFRPGSVQAGGARELFGWNMAKACLCLLPLLAMAAAAGAAASARLGAVASLALVMFLVVLVAGRDVILDAAAFVVDAGEAEAEAEHEGSGHAAHDEHDHATHVSALQVALAKGAQQGMRLVPDAASFWRFDDLASGRAVRAGDVGHAFASGLLPCAVLLGASWFLFRRRELQPS
ncbi:MAG: hypothetical protein K8T90_01035 [Planctomycetes bacterium]|nr:hypothetical protein [Planctomycetota bacterium]